MLGVTTYQESLRVVGALLDDERAGSTPAAEAQGRDSLLALPDNLIVEEQPEAAAVHLQLNGVTRTIDVGEVEALVLASRAQRGTKGASPSSELSDLLRAVGYALDDLRAHAVRIEVHPERMHVRYQGREHGDAAPHELAYAGDELLALREVAVQRRKGNPLRNVLILHEDWASSAPLRDLLVAEFAVEDLPSIYAPAVARAGRPPDLVIVHMRKGPDCARALSAIRTVRTSPHTARTPIVAVAGPECEEDPATIFEAGADDFLPEPFAAAQLRARLRTWLLRGPREPRAA